MDSNFNPTKFDHSETEDIDLLNDEVLLEDLSDADIKEEALASLSDRDLGKSYSINELKATYFSQPDVTGGDVDDNWYQAEVSGEEAIGGDTPTPDQNVTDDILQSVGLDREDEDEEVQTHDQLIERDRDRWELEPESSEDYPGRAD
ncbi:MAG: DUF6335 family protein [Snowella sp.]|nr:DUF6335 family protein [Snowella sp.]